MLLVAHDAREAARVGHHVPRERHRHVLVADQTVSVVPKVVFRRQTFVIQDGIFAPLNDFVPQNDLVQFIIRRLVFRRQVEKQLLHVPIEEMSQIRLQVPTEEAQVIFRAIRREIWNVFDEKSHRLDVHIGPVFIESRGEETAKGESRDDAEGECEDGIRSGQKGMHARVSPTRKV